MSEGFALVVLLVRFPKFHYQLVDVFNSRLQLRNKDIEWLYSGALSGTYTLSERYIGVRDFQGLRVDATCISFDISVSVLGSITSESSDSSVDWYAGCRKKADCSSRSTPSLLNASIRSVHFCGSIVNSMAKEELKDSGSL